MSDKIYNVLFLCTGNTARSILAESIMRKDGRGRFRAFSAGSQPKGQVNPFALKVLASLDYPADGMRSKSWQEFAAPDAPVMDFVFTVCDSAAGESCPVWPGQPMTAHWGIEDPAAVEGTDLQKEAAFVAAFRLEASTSFRSGRNCARSAAWMARRRASTRQADAELRSIAPGGCRSVRDRASGRDRRRLRHHGRDVDQGHRAGASRKHPADRRDPRRADHDSRAYLRRAL